MCEDRMKTLKTCKNSENLPPVNFLCFVIIPANKQQKDDMGSRTQPSPTTRKWTLRVITEGVGERVLRGKSTGPISINGSQTGLHGSLKNMETFAGSLKDQNSYNNTKTQYAFFLALAFVLIVHKQWVVKINDASA